MSVRCLLLASLECPLCAKSRHPANPSRDKQGDGATKLKDGTRSTLDSFRDHFDSSAGAFGLAKPAALAIIVIKSEAVARTQFNHCIVRADAVAVVALETIAA